MIYGPKSLHDGGSRTDRRHADRVALRHDQFIIECKGKPLAALVPVERLEQMRQFARQHALSFLENQKEGPGNKLSDDKARSMALQAQREVRQTRHKGQAKPKPTRSRK